MKRLFLSLAALATLGFAASPGYAQSVEHLSKDQGSQLLLVGNGGKHHGGGHHGRHHKGWHSGHHYGKWHHGYRKHHYYPYHYRGYYSPYRYHDYYKPYYRHGYYWNWNHKHHDRFGGHHKR